MWWRHWFFKKTRGFVKAGHHLDQQIGRQLRHSRKRTFEHFIDPRISTNYPVKSIFLKILIPISNRSGNCYLRICSCLACVYRVMDARGKFGEHEKCARVARLYFCCLLDQDLKGQCRWKNWAILRWFLAHVILLACVNKDFVYSGSIGLI